MTRGLFWGAAAALIYSYLAFPVLVLLRALIRPRPHRRGDISPSVTVVVAAHNEASTIGRKLMSVLEQDYPAEQLTIVVASDGSDDGTPAVVAGLARPNVTVLDLPRVGKAEALAAGVAVAKGAILVFSDANSIFAPGALRQLVRSFEDPRVGGVAGNQVYVPAGSQDAIAVGEQSYWDFDRVLKEAQSRAGHVTGATGALYAIRRESFRPIPPGVNDDFYLSLAVIDSGSRMVFEPEAVAYEAVAASRALEYGRRVRIMTRGLRCVAAVPRVLDPRRTGFYALQVFSHKVLMRVMAVPLAVVALTGMRLYRRSFVYRLATWSQLLFYGLASAGLALARRPAGHSPVLALPAYFCVVQVASLHAAWNLLTGRTYDRWQPSREPVTPAADDERRTDRA
jgi:cellulose synthase/poly-beta-1,6-N-acetylglucosamine synthase-like glycosyltransferase